MSTERNKETVYRNFEEVWSQGKLEVSEEILAPDFVFLLGVPPYRVDGPGAYNQLVIRNRTAWENLTYKPDRTRTVAEGDMVVAPWTMTGKQVGTWAGFTASHVDASIHGMTYFRFVGDKIVEAQVQNEALSLVRQIGGIAPAGVGTEYKIVEANKALVRRYVEEMLIGGDFSHADELVAPGFSIDRSAMPEAIAGPESLHKQMDTLKAAFPDLDLQLVDLFGENDKVAVRFEAPGTHQGEFAGIAATGRPVKWKGIAVYHVVDGRIAHAWADWDDIGLIQSLQ